ncbi:MAG TPA: GNAT family N-acetyltransferase [Bacteroidia bacterium]|nr:GNAT family N-acetyltransferase [Bacteroidia bacterium]
MQPIINKISRKFILNELTPERFVRKTNNGNNEIYVITHHNSPYTMMEIGRLRELTFRYAGGGTGKSLDIDEYDVSSHPYKQLLVWNPEHKEIVGAYRYIKCKDAGYKHGQIDLATTELFKFSPAFYNNYLDQTIELGRSFVQPSYQPGEQFRKGLFSLDNLWDGLGAIIVDNPDCNYFFGKVTMYTHFNKEARDMILAFMKYYFPDKENLVKPIGSSRSKRVSAFVKRVVYPSKSAKVTAFVKSLEGLPYKDGHMILNKNVRELGENIPPLVNAYMNLSPSMKTFGTAINKDFGEVEETGIMVCISDIYESKKQRHVDSYLKEKGLLK